MKLTCDPQQGVAYMRLRGKRADVETVRNSDELNIDLAPDGTVYGIESPSGNEQLAPGADGKLAGEATGRCAEDVNTGTLARGRGETAR